MTKKEQYRVFDLLHEAIPLCKSMVNFLNILVIILTEQVKPPRSEDEIIDQLCGILRDLQYETLEMEND